jgi:hypothetical protein
MSEINPGFLAKRTELPINKGQFAAANSVTTNAEQFIPPGGTVTSTTVTTYGILVSTPATSITEYYVQFTGDAANVAGQTMTPKLYYLRAGVATLIPGSTGSALATTAGAKSTSVALAAAFNPVAGDVILASLTPSAGLTAALTGVMVALG